MLELIVHLQDSDAIAGGHAGHTFYVAIAVASLASRNELLTPVPRNVGSPLGSAPAPRRRRVQSRTLGLEQKRRHGGNEGNFCDTRLAMTGDVARHFAATHRMADEGRIVQIERIHQLRERAFRLPSGNTSSRRAGSTWCISTRSTRIASGP